MKKFFITYLLAILCICSYASNADSLYFEILFKDNTFKLHQKYRLNNTDSVKIDVCKFYISDIQIKDSSNQTFNVTQKYNLIDLSIEKNIKIKLPSISNINSINIKLGIDSLESYSPNFDGDLDPIHGMYWTWQSGFINFKIEGVYYNSNNNSIPFTFHIGGFSHPFNALQQITLQKNSNHIFIDLQQFLATIDFKKKQSIMSPCEDAIKFAEVFKNCFK